MANEPQQRTSCSFCGKAFSEVRKLIHGPGVTICDECVDLCNDIITEEFESETLATDIPETETEMHALTLISLLRRHPWARLLVRRAPRADGSDS